MIDATILTRPRSDSAEPVTSAIYTIQVLMNEENPSGTNEQQIEAFENEMQAALDAGFFAGLRYDFMQFEVVSRIPVFIDPATKEEQ